MPITKKKLSPKLKNTRKFLRTTPNETNKVIGKIMLAERLRQALKLSKIEPRAFAVEMGVPTTTVNRWISGKHNFTVDTMLDIEFTLGKRVFFY